MGTYADYISLLCPTLSGIQKMLHICEEYAFNYKITLNATKSQLLYFSYLGKTGQVGLGVGSWPSNRATKGSNKTN